MSQVARNYTIYDDQEVFRAANDFFGVGPIHHPKSGRTFEWVF